MPASTQTSALLQQKLQRKLQLRLQKQLQQRREQHLYRQRRLVLGPQGPWLELEQGRTLNFCSNDYLGLANHPEVVKALQRGADIYGSGSGASHLICGHTRAHHQLELELAQFTGRSRALLFSTGYMANLGAICALTDKEDVVFQDKLNHASLIDAGRLSDAKLQRYPHRDTQALERLLLKTSSTGDKLIATDGVFSMDGHTAPLPQLVQLAQQHQAWLMVDDAHGLGVCGTHGKGSCDGYSEAQIPIFMGTLGKSLGSFGAFIAGSEELIETLIQTSRSYTYTTAMPAAVAEATRAALRLSISDDWRREKLQSLVLRFRSGAQQLGFELTDSHTPIQALIVGDNARAMQLSEALMQQNIWISAIRPPTVPKGSARLRITFSAAHEEQHVEQLLAALETAMSGLSKP